MMHEVSDRIGSFLLRRVAPMHADELLSEEEMDLLRPRMRKLSKRLALFVAVVLPPLIFGLSYICNEIELYVNQLPEQAFYVKRSSFAWVLVGGPLAGALGCFLSRSFIGWQLGEPYEVYERYRSSSQGYSERVAAPWIIVGCLVFAAGFGILNWNHTIAVHQDGIHLKSGILTARDHAFHEVRKVGVYDRFVAPIGIRDRPNLRVWFDDDSPMDLGIDEDLSRQRLLEICYYVADHAGIDCEVGPMRPGEEPEDLSNSEE